MGSSSFSFAIGRSIVSGPATSSPNSNGGPLVRFTSNLYGIEGTVREARALRDLLAPSNTAQHCSIFSKVSGSGMSGYWDVIFDEDVMMQQLRYDRRHLDEKMMQERVEAVGAA